MADHIFRLESELQNMPEAAPSSFTFSVSEKLARYGSSAVSKELFQELGWVLNVVAEIETYTEQRGRSIWRAGSKSLQGALNRLGFRKAPTVCCSLLLFLLIILAERAALASF